MQKNSTISFEFGHAKGVSPETEGEWVFTKLLKPYRGLFSELDQFCASLSIYHEKAGISFKLVIFAPPPSPQFNQEWHYPILAIRELPEQRGYYNFPIPYNMLILSEGQLYTGRLDRQILGFQQGEGLFTQEFDNLLEEPQEDVNWRRQLAIETIKFLTRIHTETGSGEEIVQLNHERHLDFRRQEQSVPWWKRSWTDRLNPGAVWPEELELDMMRRNIYRDDEGHLRYNPSSHNRLVSILQQVA